MSYVPALPHLRAEQVESWAFQAGMSHGTNTEITGHHSATFVLQTVDEDEKPSILAAWERGYKNGRFSRG